MAALGETFDADENKIVTGSYKYNPALDEDQPEEYHICDINEEKKDIVTMVLSELERRQRERRPFELQWLLNINFLRGNQFCDIAPNGEQIIDEIPLRIDEVQQAYNHIAPIYETRMSKLNRIQPTMHNRPATSELNDITSAKVSTQVLNSNWRKQDMSIKRMNTATIWSEVCGTVFYKNVWDVNGGRLLGRTREGTVYEGDAKTLICSPFEIFPDSNCYEDIQDCRSVIHVKAYSVEDIETIWGKRLKGTTIDVFGLENTGMRVGGGGFSNSLPAITETKRENSERVIEYYERPTFKYPKGRIFIVAGEQLIFYGALPYINAQDNKREYPFVRQICIENPGYIWGISVIERLIPVQRAYNAIKNRRQEFINRANNNVLLVEENSISTEIQDRIEAEGLSPGAVLPYKVSTNNKPAYLEANNSPPDMNYELESLMNDFIIISGVSELSRNSATPTGTTSGTALEILQSQDDTRISLVGENKRIAAMAIGKQILYLYRQFATEMRIDNCIGENSKMMQIVWRGSDLSADDLVFDTENEMANTPAQNRQFLLELWGRGFFKDDGTISRADRARFLKEFKLGDWENAYSGDELHIERASSENIALGKKKQIPEILEIDDDAVHLQEHTKYALTEDFKDMYEKDPDLMKIMLEHIKEHKTSQKMKAEELVKDQTQIQMAGQMQDIQALQQQNQAQANYIKALEMGMSSGQTATPQTQLQ